MTPHRDMRPANEPPTRHPRIVLGWPRLSWGEQWIALLAITASYHVVREYHNPPTWAMALLGGVLGQLVWVGIRRGLRKTWDS